jgi:hypothetical protein
MKLPDLDALARDPEPPGLPERTRLRALARRLRERDGAELASTLEAALHLFEAAERSQGRLGAGRLQSMARNLLAQLAGPVTELLAPPAALPESGPSEPAPRQPEEQRGLGWILVELGYATEEEVEAALELQRAKGLRIGECLLMLGSVSPDRLLSALRVQEGGGDAEPSAAPATSKGAPPAFRVTDAIFLGEVALGLELITGEQLEEAMHLHHHEGLRIGEALVKLGYLTEAGLEQALEMQRCLQSVARMAPAQGRLSLGVPRGRSGADTV